jgi:hypothetical protein
VKHKYWPNESALGKRLRTLMLVIRTTVDPDLIVPGIRAAVAEIDPDVLVVRV